jgi:hypothetical protein
MSINPNISQYRLSVLSSAVITTKNVTLPLRIQDKNIASPVPTTGLIDSGAHSMFIDQGFAKTNNIPITPTKTTVSVTAIDGSPIHNVTKQCCLTIQVGNIREEWKFSVINTQQPGLPDYNWLTLATETQPRHGLAIIINRHSISKYA